MIDLKDKVITAIDIETTGFKPGKDSIIEIGAVKIKNGKVLGEFSELIKPLREVSEEITALTGITNEMLQDKKNIFQILPKLAEFLGDSDYLLGHNLYFDLEFINFFENNVVNKYRVIQGREPIHIKKEFFDTMEIAAFYRPGESNKLGHVCEDMHIELNDAHRASADAMACYEVFREFLKTKKDLNLLQFIRIFGIDAKPKMQKVQRVNKISDEIQNVEDVFEWVKGKRTTLNSIKKDFIEYIDKNPKKKDFFLEIMKSYRKHDVQLLLTKADKKIVDEIFKKLD